MAVYSQVISASKVTKMHKIISLTYLLVGLFQAPKRGRFVANPEAEQKKIKDLEERIKVREDALTIPDLYSNVRVLSRHALEVEQSLHKGTVKERSLNHLVQPKKQGTVYMKMM